MFSKHLNSATLDFPTLSWGILPLLLKYKHWSLFIVRLKPVEQLSLALSVLDYEPPSERKKSPPSHVWTLQLCQSSVHWRMQSSNTRLFCPPQPSKTNTQYHKLFKEVNRDELLIKSRFQSQLLRQIPGKKDMLSCYFGSLCCRLHVRPAERDSISGENVRLGQLDLFPLQSLRQGYQGTRSDAALALLQPSLPSWRVDLSKSPDFHPRALCDLHQKNQNCSAGAERARDRNGRLSGKRSAQVLSHFSWKHAEFHLFFLSFSTCLCLSCLGTRPTNFWSLSVFIWRYLPTVFYLNWIVVWHSGNLSSISHCRYGNICLQCEHSISIFHRFFEELPHFL